MESKMKNLYKLNEFLKVRKSEKINEADRFAGDVSFSESLVGRLFNNIFGFFRKSIYTGLLMIYKRKLEDAYLEGVMKALAGSAVEVTEISQEATYPETAGEAETKLGIEEEAEETTSEEGEAVEGEKVVQMTEDEAIKIYQQIKDDKAERQKEHQEIIMYVRTTYVPENATFDQYIELVFSLEYLHSEIKAVEKVFKKEAGADVNYFKKHYHEYNESLNVEDITKQMETNLNSANAEYKKRKSETLRNTIHGAMLEAIGEWRDLAEVLKIGNEKLTRTITITGKEKFARNFKTAKDTYEKAVNAKVTTNERVKFIEYSKKLFEAQETDTEDLKNKDKTLGERFPGAKKELKDYSNLKAGEIDGNKIKERFSKDPALVETATQLVNKEKVKDIQLSAEILYTRSEKSEAANLLTKNFRADDKVKMELENKWKKLVTKVKAGYVGILDVDKIDPIVLVNQDEAMRKTALDGTKELKTFNSANNVYNSFKTNEIKDVLFIENKFPMRDLWWAILKVSRNEKSTDVYGVLVYKFNVPTVHTSTNSKDYQNNFFSFIPHRIYKPELFFAEKDTLSGLENFNEYILPYNEDNEGIYNYLGFDRGKPASFFVKRDADVQLPKIKFTTGRKYYDAWGFNPVKSLNASYHRKMDIWEIQGGDALKMWDIKPNFYDNLIKNKILIDPMIKKSYVLGNSTSTLPLQKKIL